MPGVEVDPLAPEPFSGWWLGAAALLLALALALIVLPPLLRKLWRKLRRRRADRSKRDDSTRPASAEPADALKQVDLIERRWRAGEVTDRTAAHQIASTVRQFTGSEASVLTLLELRLKGDRPDLTALIEAAYPVEFGVKGEGDISALANRARRVVAP
ncbi:MAG: hypothetical protein LBG11_12275 [Bifidobacteriaceae bacterium]|jgi:hypothetical protein|nr:hypothetical protein [Bifidobacteriaceae bacterium]